MRRAAVVLLLLTACGGPRAPLDVGVNNYSTDVILGSQSTPAPAVEPVEVLIAAPFVPPPPRRPASAPEPEPEEPFEPCPKGDPRNPARYEVTNRIFKPPIPATYVVRNTGVFRAGAFSSPYPATSTRTILNVQTPTGTSFTFDIQDVYLPGAALVTTSYRVQSDGLYMTKQVSKLFNATSTFTPMPQIRLLPFPAEDGAQWDSFGIDTSTFTTMAIHGLIGGGPDVDENGQADAKARVDACGTNVDGWYVSITGPGGQGPAKIVGPGGSFDYTALFAIGTQFGGVPISEKVLVVGEDYKNENVAVISQEPGYPGL